MAITKTRSTVQASATNTAGSTTTSSYLDVSGDYDTEIVGQITNGGTGPTVACSVSVQVADSGSSNPITVGGMTGSLAASAVVPFRIPIPRGASKVRTVFTGNTGQSVTVEAYAERVTAI